MERREVNTRILAALSDTYTVSAVVDVYHRRRGEWGGLSAYEMVNAGRGDEVIAWAESLAGGPVGHEE